MLFGLLEPQVNLSHWFLLFAFLIENSNGSISCGSLSIFCLLHFLDKTLKKIFKRPVNTLVCINQKQSVIFSKNKQKVQIIHMSFALKKPQTPGPNTIAFSPRHGKPTETSM